MKRLINTILGRDKKLSLSPDNNEKFFNEMMYWAKICLFLISAFLSVLIKGSFEYLPMIVGSVILLFEPLSKRVSFFVFEMLFLNIVQHLFFVTAVFTALFLIEYCFDIYLKQKKFNYKIYAIFVLIIGYVLLPIGEFSYPMTMNFLFVLINLYLFINYVNDLDKWSILKNYYIGIVIISIVSYLSTTASNELSNMFLLKINDGSYRFCGIMADPNYFGSFIVLGITSLLFAMYKNKISIIEFFVLYAVLFIMTLLTISKMTLILTAFIVLFFIILLLCKKDFYKKQKILIISLIIILSVIFLLSFNSVIKSFLGRLEEIEGSDNLINGNEPIGNETIVYNDIFSQNNIEKSNFLIKVLDRLYYSKLGGFLDKLSTYRFQLWVLFISKLSLNIVDFIFGAGEVMIKPTFILTDGETIRDPHSTLVEIFYCYGLLFSLVIITLIIISLVKLIKNKKLNLFSIAVIFNFVFITGSLTFLGSSMPLVLIFISMLMCVSDNKQSQIMFNQNILQKIKTTT